MGCARIMTERETEHLTAEFAEGLSVGAYADLLLEDKRALHRLHEERATVEPAVAARLRDSAVNRGLVITEPWCGDSLAIFPVLAKLFAAAGLELRVVLRDEHPDLIDRYLTRGGRAIPILIALGEANEPLFRWGPRPAPAQALVEGYREAIAAGQIEKIQVHKKVRAFYAQDGGETILREILDAVAKLV